MGYRFRLHPKNLPGKPDIVLPKHHKVIFVNGCFWHGHRGCNRAGRPATNIEFWNRKLDRNLKRDETVQKELRVLGWKVLVVWECKTRDVAKLLPTLTRFMR
jgi:DNA mismatch endonuclease (patch repair protein)